MEETRVVKFVLVDNNKRIFSWIRADSSGDPAGPHVDLPGGKVDPGETLLQAAHRELEEEISPYGLDLREQVEVTLSAAPNGHSQARMQLSGHRYSHYQIMVWGISISGTKPLVPLETQKNLMAQWRDPEEVWLSFRGPRAQYGIAARLAWKTANSSQYGQYNTIDSGCSKHVRQLAEVGMNNSSDDDDDPFYPSLMCERCGKDPDHICNTCNHAYCCNCRDHHTCAIIEEVSAPKGHQATLHGTTSGESLGTNTNAKETDDTAEMLGIDSEDDSEFRRRLHSDSVDVGSTKIEVDINDYLVGSTGVQLTECAGAVKQHLG